MQTNYSPELKELLGNIEAALIRASQNARFLAEQTGTQLVIKERTPSGGILPASDNSNPPASSPAVSPTKENLQKF